MVGILIHKKKFIFFIATTNSCNQCWIYNIILYTYIFQFFIFLKFKNYFFYYTLV
uniref:Uncharacterized protein n=1 Tax=Pleurostomum flabellatum TaxID=405751 RepID=A0A7T0M443_9EUKA|nr:hypothetical protein J6731_mgp37 [Pleurostomum flabellatum]QPL15638.1 hypothetical protein [Pleurostomum flabellatum]